METGIHYPLRLDSLPRGWRAGYVGDFAEDIEPGFASGEHNQTGTGVAHLRPMNIDRDGKIDLSVTKFVSADKDRRRLTVGDVLFNNTNSPELVGKTTVVNVPGDFAFSNHMTRIRFDDRVLPKFGALQLHFLWMRGYFQYNCVKHVNQASVSSRTLGRAVPFVWAPLDEQERIVGEIEKQFSRLDEAVANLKRVKANLKRYRAAVLKDAVEGRLVPTEADLARREGHTFETGAQLLQRILDIRRGKWKGKYEDPAQSAPMDLPPLPEGWAWARLGAVASIKGGITVDKKRRDSTARPVPYLRVANVQRGYLDLKEIKLIDAPQADIDELRLQPGDILFNEGGDRDKLGRGWIWEGQLRECIHQNHVFRARLFSDELSPKFVSWWGNTFGRHYFLREGKQTTNLASINMTKLSALPVPMPPAAEQQRIVAEVDWQLSVFQAVKTAVTEKLLQTIPLRSQILANSLRPYDKESSTYPE